MQADRLGLRRLSQHSGYVAILENVQPEGVVQGFLTVLLLTVVSELWLCCGPAQPAACFSGDCIPSRPVDGSWRIWIAYQHEECRSASYIPTDAVQLCMEAATKMQADLLDITRAIHRWEMCSRMWSII